MARRRRYSGRRGRAKRPITWASNGANPIDFAQTVSTQGIYDANVVAGAAQDNDFTVLRTHGTGRVSLAGAGSTAAADILVGLGIGVVTAEAAAAGAVPTPLQSADWDGWFWHWSGHINQLTTTFDATDNRTYFDVPISSKAMRRVEDGNVLVFVTEQVLTLGAPGTAALSYNAFIRQLIKYI